MKARNRCEHENEWMHMLEERCVYAFVRGYLIETYFFKEDREVNRDMTNTNACLSILTMQRLLSCSEFLDARAKLRTIVTYETLNFKIY